VQTRHQPQVSPAAEVDIRAEVPKFVSRAGLKLEKALEHFGIAVEGRVCLDSGLSTGGFTDCLLQRGAGKVQTPTTPCILKHEEVESETLLNTACVRCLCTWPDASTGVHVT
jgi:hypothetical protein